MPSRVPSGHFIDGGWLGSRASFKTFDPATGLALAEHPCGGASEVDRAVAAAKRALEPWRRVPVARRGEILLEAMRVLSERKEAIARLATREMGKVLAETRGDVQEAIDTAFYYAGEGRRLFGVTTTSELEAKFAMAVRAPVGVCGLIAPWNFPVAIPSWKVLPAVLCGNTVVLKPSEYTPGSAVEFVRALADAGIPEGVVNLVLGDHSAGAALVEHPDVRLVSFTGSSQVGSEIAAKCARSFKKVSLEMGGKNAQIVMEDADLDLALEGALWGAFGTTGQRCTATSRLIVHEAVYDEFVGRLVERARALRVGPGLDEASQMGPIVSRRQLENVERWVRIGLQQDKARLLTGGRRPAFGACGKGFFFEPTVFEGSRSMRIAREEIFGPVVVALKAASFEEAVEAMNDVPYGLSGSIYTRDIRRVMRAVESFETGIAYVNAPTIGAEIHLPFGGVKRTGNGHRESGTAALDIFTEWKAVYIDYSGRLQRAQIDSRDRLPSKAPSRRARK